MLMVIFMTDNGKMTKLMDSVNTLILMELSTKDTGLMINNMVKERKSGQMVHSMKVTINLVRKMEEESSCGLIGLHTMVTSSTTIFTVKENTNGLMVVNTKDIGLTVSNTVKAITS